MTDRVKRVLFAVGFLLIVAVAGAALYWVFIRGGLPGIIQPPGGGGTEQPGGTGGLAPAGTGGDRTPAESGSGALPSGSGGFVQIGGSATAPAPQTVLLRDGVTQGVSPSADGRGARYYNPDDGKFYRVTDDGVTTALSDTNFPSVESVTWANDTDQAVLTFPDGRNVSYDFRTNKQSTLPTHWEDFAFSPDDRQIVSKSVAVSPEARFLVISNADGSSPEAIEPLGENEDKVYPTWTPNNQIIAYALVGEAQGFDRQEIILVGKNHENFRALQVEGRGFQPLWSPDGATVLYSVWNAASDYRPELWTSGGNSTNMNQNRTKLGIQTWANKCVWRDTVTIYCAVPDSLPRGAGLQPTLFRTQPDSFYKIDLRTGAQTLLGSPQGAGAAEHLVLTESGDALIFTDAQSGRLYQFNIP